MTINLTNEMSAHKELRDAQDGHDLEPQPIIHFPQQNIPPNKVAVELVSFSLVFGVCIGACLCMAFRSESSSRVWMYYASWASTLWAQLAITAGWGAVELTTDSHAWTVYSVGILIGHIEFEISRYFFPASKSYAYISYIGFVLLFLGQVLRSWAIIQASRNGSYPPTSLDKVEGHHLLTDGAYRYFRHPCDAGPFYWALGMQLLLQNPISFSVFLIVMWRFLYPKFQAEEDTLIEVYGDEYRNYRKRVGTKIPFIP
ncbi:ICMT-domain-containing protein [Crepidotus variabilis]|uniref:Protein-S-isoprenylcysteine O-methyltransferase n=1 Tax=Crepidotus variabilis TaxID=179855 RepID=A0A9P6JPL4_9AGAR|nr:ICMT-domain-containing protein [Crepidotus variabilis]